jgi:hypothetical protein
MSREASPAGTASLLKLLKNSGLKFSAAFFMMAALLFFLFSGASAAGKSNSKGSLYILSTGKDGASGINTLLLADIETNTLKNVMRLEKGHVESLCRDPYGRIWAGYSSPDGRRENRVQITGAEGSFSKTIHTAENPEAGFAFSWKKAFIACTQNGFSGAIDVFDLDTLKRIKTIRLTSGKKNSPYYLTAIAGDAKRIVVVGMTAGPLQNMNYCIITIIDPDSLSVISQTKPLEGVDVWCILPYRGEFLMLNSAAQDKTGIKSADILWLGADNKIKEISYVPSPLLGAIQGDTLYAYHNRAFNSVSGSPSRMLSAYNLKTKEHSSWPLPDRWDCSGIAVDGMRILLLNSEAPDKNARGVYSFDIKEKRLSLLMGISGARRMLIEK